MCTMAAPALAASRQELAICSGVTGPAGFLPGVSAEPVTAQEIINFRAMPFSLGSRFGSAADQRRVPGGGPGGKRPRRSGLAVQRDADDAAEVALVAAFLGIARDV